MHGERRPGHAGPLAGWERAAIVVLLAIMAGLVIVLTISAASPPPLARRGGLSAQSLSAGRRPARRLAVSPPSAGPLGRPRRGACRAAGSSQRVNRQQAAGKLPDFARTNGADHYH
jgi:hypothetical protein